MQKPHLTKDELKSLQGEINAVTQRDSFDLASPAGKWWAWSFRLVQEVVRLRTLLLQHGVDPDHLPEPVKKKRTSTKRRMS